MSEANELEQIRERHEYDGGWIIPEDCVQMYTDRATLLRLLDAARETQRDAILAWRKRGAELDAAREELDKEQVSHLKTRAKLTGIREASELIAGPVAWLDSWAKHVSNCKGGYSCTCGLVLARQEALGALEALTRAQGESS